MGLLHELAVKPPRLDECLVDTRGHPRASAENLLLDDNEVHSRKPSSLALWRLDYRNSVQHRGRHAVASFSENATLT